MLIDEPSVGSAPQLSHGKFLHLRGETFRGPARRLGSGTAEMPALWHKLGQFHLNVKTAPHTKNHGRRGHLTRKRAQVFLHIVVVGKPSEQRVVNTIRN